MRIDVNRIPPEGLVFREELSPKELDLDTEIVSFPSSLKIEAQVERISNAISVNLALNGSMSFSCSRCLKEFGVDLGKKIKLNYLANKQEPVIDLNADIREEIILDYPLKPLCSPDCKGLCPKCGKNLNEGKCNCNF